MYFENRFKIEWWLLELLDRMQNKLFDLLAFLISYIGTGPFHFVLILTIYYLVDKEKGKKIGFILSIMMIFNNFLKTLFAAKRPFEFAGHENLRKLNESMDGATGTSFPSGHVQNTTAILTTTSETFKKRFITITSIVLIIIVALSRIYLGVHFPGDVIVATFLGLTISLFACYMYNHATKNWHKYMIVILPLIATIPTLIIEMNNPVSADIFKSFGFALGFMIAMFCEEKFCQFDQNVPFKTKVIRFIAAGLFTMICYSTKFILPSHNLLALLRYTLVSIGGFLIVPLIIRKKKHHEKYQ